MPMRHVLFAMIVILTWGLNFILLKIGLDQLTPLMLCAARFILASIPAIFFVKPPKVAFSKVVYYGLTMMGMQFLFLFIGMNAGVSPSLSSLIMQLQVFFTLFFAAVWWNEIPSVWQLFGAMIAFSGIVLVATHVENHATVMGIIFILTAAAFWGVGNIISKSMGAVNMLGLVVWGSFVASLLMTTLSLIVDGPTAIVTHFTELNTQGVLAVIFIAYASTLVGYGIWSWLLNHHPVSTVAPFTLAVPIIAMISSALILGEELEPWKLFAGALVLSGLTVNLLGARLQTWLTRNLGSAT